MEGIGVLERNRHKGCHSEQPRLCEGSEESLLAPGEMLRYAQHDKPLACHFERSRVREAQ